MLGLLFFSLFINDIFHLYLNSLLICFADDTVVFPPFKLLNFFIRKNILSHIDHIIVNNVPFYFCNSYNYLGITIDYNLKFTAQYNMLLNEVFNSNGSMIYRLKEVISAYDLINLFFWYTDYFSKKLSFLLLTLTLLLKFIYFTLDIFFYC